MGGGDGGAIGDGASADGAAPQVRRTGEWLEELLQALYPPLCWLCGHGTADGVACDAHALPAAPPGARCPRCAAQLPRALERSDRCAACRREPFGLERTFALADYRAQPAIREWILAFKHGSRRELAGPLGAALSDCVRERLETLAQAEGERADVAHVLVPVPLHTWRRVERGYDQSALLARAVGERGGWPVAEVLRRVRATTVQGEAGSSSRSANVHEAFAPVRFAPFARRKLARASWCWLVDDVCTSGATLRECARVLRRLGARRVGALVLARAADGAESELGIEPDSHVQARQAAQGRAREPLDSS